MLANPINFFGQLALLAADHGGLFACVDEQHFALALFLLGQEPQVRGDFCVEEHLARHGHHDFHHIGVQHCSTDLAFAVLAAAPATVGQNNARPARGLEVVRVA